MGLGLYFLFICLPVYVNRLLMFLPAVHSPHKAPDNLFASIYLQRDLGCVLYAKFFIGIASALCTLPLSVINLRFIVGADFRPKYK